ncbi:MAG: BamA/TamA family outer membrane protein, partial [Gemmatimonadota bacterium]
MAALAFSEDGGRGEGAQLVFSDQLGDHLIVAQVNSQSGRSNLFSGFTGVASYINIKNRINWGVSAYRLRSVYTSLLEGDFGRGGLEQEGIGIRNDFFESRWGGSGLVAYPLSKFQRIEGELTVERNEITELPNGPEDFDDLFLRDAWLAIGSFSYIYDNALWSAAGPIDGQRMNLTVSAVGNVTDTGVESTEVLLDARKYFRTSLHTTYAVRARGRIATGDVPTFYYLGGPASLRGYPRYLLNGNYTALLNQEWRFPIIRPGGQREGWATLLGNGIWGALFVDVGNAWTDATTLTASDGTTRHVGGYPGLLGSYGASLRYPLAGPFILRFDWARRFDIEETRELFPGEQDKTHFSF